MKLESIKDYIYKNCADRINERIKEKKLSYRTIYHSDPRIIGKICKCEIIEKRNDYLIQDSVRDELKKKLSFDSYQDMLWGSSNERVEQFPTIFLLVLTDLVDSSSPYKDKINSILCDYTPYARYIGYYKIIFEQNPIIPEINNENLYNIDTHEMLSSIDYYFSCAVNHLYMKCKNDFIKLYNKFVENRDSFKRWTFRFEEWITNELIPMLEKYTPSQNSLGMRILRIIEEDYCKIPLLNISSNPYEINVIQNLLSSSEKYISALEDIQLNNPYVAL